MAETERCRRRWPRRSRVGWWCAGAPMRSMTRKLGLVVLAALLLLLCLLLVGGREGSPAAAVVLAAVEGEERSGAAAHLTSPPSALWDANAAIRTTAVDRDGGSGNRGDASQGGTAAGSSSVLPVQAPTPITAAPPAVPPTCQPLSSLFFASAGEGCEVDVRQRRTCLLLYPSSSSEAEGRLSDLSRYASSLALSNQLLMWRVGPRTPSEQAPLQNTLPSYFHNVTRSHTVTVTSAATAASPGRSADAGVEVEPPDDDTHGCSADVARRLRRYNALYAARPLRASAATVDRRSPARPHPQADEGLERVTHGGRDAVLHPILALLSPVLTAAQMFGEAVTALVGRSAVPHRLECLAVEAIENMRAFAWRSTATWRRLFLRRRIIIRFPVGTWSRATAAGADANIRGGGGEHRPHVSAEQDHGRLDDNELAEAWVGGGAETSRAHMIHRGTSSVLRIISFPPVAQIAAAPPSVSYVCDLSAVHDALQLVEEAAVGGNRGRATRGEGRAVPPPTVASSPSVVLSIVKDVVRLLVRMLFGEAPHVDDKESYDGGGDGADLHRANAAAAMGGSWRASRRPPSMQKVGRRTAAAAAPAVVAAEGFLARVREELGPYQPSAASLLPSVLQQLLGRRAMVVTRMELEEEEERGKIGVAAASRRERRVSFYLRWEAALSAGTPMCLALLALPPSSSEWMEGRGEEEATAAAITGSSASLGIPLLLEDVCEVDVVWMQVMLLTWVVLQLERRVASNSLVRHIITGLTGTLLLTLLLLFYAVRRLQRMPVGQLLVVVALLLGGSTAALEGVLNIIWNHYALSSLLSTGVRSSFAAVDATAEGAWREDVDDGFDSAATTSSVVDHLSLLPILGCGALLLCCVSSGVALNWLVPGAALRTATRWSVRAVLVFLSWLCVQRNAEATLLVVIVSTVGRRLGRWCLHRAAPSNVKRQPAAATVEKAEADPLCDPLDCVPPEAQLARGYVTPLAVSSHRGGYAGLQSSEARLRRYEEEGAECTRQALEALSSHLRAHPGRYASRLRDPNGVQRWAGAADSEDDIADDELK